MWTGASPCRGEVYEVIEYDEQMDTAQFRVGEGTWYAYIVHPDTTDEIEQHWLAETVPADTPLTDPSQPGTYIVERLARIDQMLETVAALYDPVAHVTFEVDDVIRDGAGRIVAILGTRTAWFGDAREDGSTYDAPLNRRPYILGEVP
jgi:hypothetical protein